MKACRLRWEANTLHNPTLCRLPGSRVFTSLHLGICSLLTSVLLCQTFFPFVCNTWFSCIHSNLPPQIPAQKPWPPLSLPETTHLSSLRPVAFAQCALAQILPSGCVPSPNSLLWQTVPSTILTTPFSWKTSPQPSKPTSSVPSGSQSFPVGSFPRHPPTTHTHTHTHTHRVMLPPWSLPSHTAVNLHTSVLLTKWPAPWRQGLSPKL